MLLIPEYHHDVNENIEQKKRRKEEKKKRKKKEEK